MICAPAVARPAVRMGVWGGTAESAARTAQMITHPERQTRESVRKQRGHSLAAAQPHQKIGALVS
jgi:hypothetical protein